MIATKSNGKDVSKMTSFKRLATGMALTVLCAGAITGCDNFLDVNKNPNTAEDVRMDVILPGVLMRFTQDIQGYPTERYGATKGFDSWGSEWLQQWSWNRERRTYSQFQHYDISSGDSDQPWNAAYQTVMNQAHQIMLKAEAVNEWGYHGIAKLILAWTASRVTDSWGPAPMSQALDPRLRDPGYDSQEEIYKKVHLLLEEAIAEMSRADARSPGAADLLYGGDMTKWVKLARTVQARLHLRLSRAPGESATARAQLALDALAEGFTSNDDDADFTFIGGSGARSSTYQFEDEGWQEPQTASHFYVELLRGLNDPRLPISIRPALSDSAFRGHLNGTIGEPDSTISKIGSYFTADSAAINWISYAEAKFIEAEARLIIEGPAAADAAYRAGIEANMQKMGVEQADIDAYLAARPALNAEPNALEALITQKYIANFLRGEVWNDWRRTGYPAVTPVAERVIDGIPQRFRTPAGEMSYNANNVAATGIPTGLSGMLVKVWWASGNP
jgi:hypothetical protein